MGAGIYVAIGSEKEVKKTEWDKRRFLGEDTVAAEMEEQPLGSALVVGGSYFAGAMVPVLPVLFGAKDTLFSLLTAGSMIILVSMVLAFLTGMDVKKRILTNLIIITCTVAITYAIGIVAKTLWGVSV
jgi:VIT1/CCC1 family predicted Fe2+/Mn2+ transporter